MEFRVWAPNATRAAVRVGTRGHDLVSAGDGVWEAIVKAGADPQDPETSRRSAAAPSATLVADFAAKAAELRRG